MRSSVPTFILVHLLLFFHLHFPSPSHAFAPPKNLTLFGDAYFLNGTISLTRQRHPCLSPANSSSSSGVGRALYLYPIRFFNHRSNTTASFSCRFSFTILAAPNCAFGDGLAFLITSKAESFGSSNGFLGLPESTPDSQDSFIAVEFDTSFDPVNGDINDNHVGIDLNRAVSFASVDVLSKGIDLKSEREITSWIEYSDAMKLIRIWVGYTLLKPLNPILATQVDLSKIFKEYMHVGFSASNGEGSALHVVKKWRFKTFGSYPSVTAPQDTTEEDEGVCIVCSPEELQNITTGADSHLRRGTRIDGITLGLDQVTVTLAISMGLVFILAIAIFLVVRKKGKLGTQSCSSEQNCRAQMNRMPARLSIADIRSATAGFSPNKIVGRGASATVYKGSLPSGGGAVAVKRFDRANLAECSRNLFTTEFATMAGCLRHKNLVQLQGWCCEGSELVLVYEYLPNGSLDKFIHGKTKSSMLLSWNQCINIILGVASALSYLHEECERQIIHRDVKTCNIMLDAEFNPKLGDFGLAEVYEHSSIEARDATIPAGTMGYLAPEYVYSGVPSEKSDVYSFGVVVLEVATGRRAVEEDGMVLVDRVWMMWEKGRLVGIADQRLQGQYEAAEMERMLMVGLWCAHPNHEKRPTVKEAARVIRGEAPLPILPTRKPTVRIRSLTAAQEDAEALLLGVRIDESSFGMDDLPWMTPRSQFS